MRNDPNHGRVHPVLPLLLATALIMQVPPTLGNYAGRVLGVAVYFDEVPVDVVLACDDGCEVRFKCCSNAVAAVVTTPALWFCLHGQRTIELPSRFLQYDTGLSNCQIMVQECRRVVVWSDAFATAAQNAQSLC